MVAVLEQTPVAETHPLSDSQNGDSRDVKIDIRDITKVYKMGDVEVNALRGVSLKVYAGEFVSIIGHSGCGKSTVLSMVAGLNSVTSGAIILAGKEVTGPWPDRGVVFQSPCLLEWLTALENVRLGVDQVMARAPREDRDQTAIPTMPTRRTATAAAAHRPLARRPVTRTSKPGVDQPMVRPADIAVREIASESTGRAPASSV